MKNILSKASALLILLFVFQMTPTLAQQKSNPKQNPKSPSAQQAKRFHETSKRLGLTPEQEKQMRTIMQENREELKALKAANKDKSAEEKHKLMLEQFNKTDQKVMAILNKNQQTEWAKIKEERKVQLMKKKEEHMKHKKEIEIEETEGLL